MNTRLNLNCNAPIGTEKTINTNNRPTKNGAHDIRPRKNGAHDESLSGNFEYACIQTRTSLCKYIKQATTILNAAKRLQTL